LSPLPLCAHHDDSLFPLWQWVVFFACRGVLKTNTELTAALLPYVVQDVLTTRLEHPDRPSIAAQNVRDELLAVLSDKWVAPSAAATRGSGGADRSGGADSAATHGTALQHKCTQAIFSLLDTLKQWNKPSRSSRYVCNRCVASCVTLLSKRWFGPIGERTNPTRTCENLSVVCVDSSG